MLDGNSLTLEFAALGPWTRFISNMPIGKVHDQESIALVWADKVCIECVFQTLWVLYQKVLVKLDAEIIKWNS